MFLTIFTLCKTCIVKCGSAEFVTPRSDYRNSSEYHIYLSPGRVGTNNTNKFCQSNTIFFLFCSGFINELPKIWGVASPIPPLGTVLTLHTHMAWYFIKLPPKILV